MTTTRLMRKSAALIAVSAIAVLSAASSVAAAEGEPVIPRSQWTMNGLFGHFDEQQLQRGFRVYREVCAACHGLKYLRYRNLMEPGGPGFTEGQVQTILAEVEIQDGFTESGEPRMRKAIPADAWKGPYPNAEAARAANNGALPPDLSLITYARAAPTDTFEPVQWVKDIFNGYHEHGADYLNMLLQGYQDQPPAYKLENGHYTQISEAEATPDSPRCASITKEGTKETCNTMTEGLYYNKYFPGHQIAMPSPLTDGQIEYTDGSPMTVKQYSADVAAFLAWVADPKLEERKSVGFTALVYLLILATLLYFAKRVIWSRIGQH